MKKYNIVKSTNVIIKGRRLPQGCIYGTDKRGFWYCDKFEIIDLANVVGRAISKAEKTGENVTPFVHKIARALEINPHYKGNIQIAQEIYRKIWSQPYYEKRRNEYGEWEKQLIKPKELRIVALKIKRPRTKDNRVEWYPTYIVGEPAEHILDLVYEFPELTTDVLYLKTPVGYKQTPVIKNGELHRKCVPVISNKDARKVSGNPNGREIKEFVPFASAHYGTKTAPKEYAFETGEFYDLEKAAAENKPNHNYPKRKEGIVDIYRPGANTNMPGKPDLRKQMLKYLETAK